MTDDERDDIGASIMRILRAGTHVPVSDALRVITDCVDRAGVSLARPTSPLLATPAPSADAIITALGALANAQACLSQLSPAVEAKTDGENALEAALRKTGERHANAKDVGERRRAVTDAVEVLLPFVHVLAGQDAGAMMAELYEALQGLEERTVRPLVEPSPRKGNPGATKQTGGRNPATRALRRIQLCAALCANKLMTREYTRPQAEKTVFGWLKKHGYAAPVKESSVNSWRSSRDIAGDGDLQEARTYIAEALERCATPKDIEQVLALYIRKSGRPAR